uniref:Secreted protein n=1 Tax=Trichuris muris TaxID=70415 RepID=A0A5S6QXP2_TRIMR
MAFPKAYSIIVRSFFLACFCQQTVQMNALLSCSSLQEEPNFLQHLYASVKLQSKQSIMTFQLGLPVVTYS